MNDLQERLRRDRLLRWCVLAPLPALWLAVALADAAVLVLVPLAVLLVGALFRYGPLDRFERPDELL